MENMENLFSYTSAQFDIVSHILVLGVGAQIAGLVFFAMTFMNAAPQYRMSSALSAVVMVSAGLILLNQQLSWSNAFVWDGQMWNPSDSTFSNGYRYVNWSIDVPMLLTQLLIVLGITGARFNRIWAGFVIGGLAMIWTGYVGQFYETTDMGQLLLWGAISTVAMVYICYLVGVVCFKSAVDMPGKTGGMVRGVFWLLILSWTLYPIAYLVPWFMPSADGMVVRQVLYTVADISSKVIYGVLLGQIATIRSAYEGFKPAMESLGMTERDVQEVRTSVRH